MSDDEQPKSETVIEYSKRLVKELAQKGEFSGVVLLEQKESKSESSAGMANIDEQIPNEANTIFNIGSMNKMFTSVAIAQLVEQGKLDFQDLVGKYLPKMPKVIADKMTLHHILTHQEGCPSYFNDAYIKNYKNLNSVNDYLHLFINEPLLFKPGEKYSYSNSGYVILGAVIEAITGITFEEYVQKNIFEPANMPDSTMKVDLQNKRVAHGYTKQKMFSQEIIGDQKLRDNSTELPSSGSPAGGGYSTVGDLLNFADALLNHKLLSAEMTKIITTPKVTVGSKDRTTLYYGYGFQLLDVGDGNIRIGHAGGSAGVNARLDIYPWLNTNVAVCANLDQPSALKVANSIAEKLLQS